MSEHTEHLQTAEAPGEVPDERADPGAELTGAVTAAEQAFAAAGGVDELAAARPAHLGDRAPLCSRAAGSARCRLRSAPRPAGGSTRPWPPSSAPSSSAAPSS